MTLGGIDFLGIGAQKAATSWVWRNLGRHPEIWLPPRKELHYFDRSPSYPSPSHLATASLRSRLTGREAHHRRFRRQAVMETLSALKRRDLTRLSWTLRYFGGRIDDRWYLSLFDSARGRLTGEFTPAYSILLEVDVRRIAKLFPALKVIYMIRNPIDRAWSQIRFAWTKGRIEDLANLDAIKEYIDSPAQTMRGDYLRTLETWSAQFGRDQIFVGYYDDVVRDPAGVLRALFDFLNVRATEGHLDPENVSPAIEMPVEIGRYLAAKYRPQLVKLNEKLGGPTCQWLRDATRWLAS